MAIAKSLEQYRQIQQKRIDKLKQGKRRGPITAAKYMAAQMRLMVPRGRQSHAGYSKMYQNIKRSKNKTSVRGTNPNTGFPYVHWINMTPGINITSRGKSYLSSGIKRTGTPGFFFIASKRTRKVFRKIMLDALHKSLRAEF